MITYPPQANTDSKKMEFILRSTELLRLVHNFMGYWFNGGTPALTPTEYTNGIPGTSLGGTDADLVVLTPGLKAQFPYQPKLDQAAWDSFKRSWFRPKQSLFATEQSALRVSIGNAKTWVVDLESLV